MDGKRLKELRKSKGITQQQLANILNVDLSSIGKWELHDFTPNKTTLIQLADFFNVTIDYLLGRDNPEVLYIPENMRNIPNSPPVVVEFNNFRSGYKDCIVVYDHSGDVHEFSFNMEDIEHILNVCEAITKDYKKIKY